MNLVSKKTDPNLRHLILTDSQTINLKRFGNNLVNLLNRYEDKPIPNDIIAEALMIRADDVDDMYLRIVQRLRCILVVK